MYCANCGAELREGAAFCPQCGSRAEGAQASAPEPEPEPAPAPKPRKHSRKPIAIAAALVAVVAIAVVAVLVINGGSGGGGDGGSDDSSDDSAYAEAAENYLAVNETLTELVESSEYQDADTSERMQLVVDELAVLEDEGQIEPDSVSTNEENGLVSYHYANGAGGGVMTEDFAGNEDGVGTSSYATTYNASYDGSVKNIDASEDYTTFNVQESWPYEEESLSALVVRDLGREVDEQEIDDISGCWSANGLTTSTEVAPTVASMRTQLAGYDLVVLRLHGLVDDGTAMVYLQETVEATFGNELFKATGTTSYLSEDARVYYDDLAAGRVNMYLNDTEGLYYFALAPSFFTYYYGSAGLDGEIFWIGCCDGYTNDELVSAIASAGAEAVLGFTESTYGDYGTLMADAVVYSLLYGNTVDASIEFARSVWGDNDSAWLATYYPEEDADETPAELRAYNGGGVTLVTLTEEAEESLTDELAVYQDVIDQYAQAYQAYLDGDLSEDSVAEEQCEGATDYWTWPVSDDYTYVTYEILQLVWRYWDEGTPQNYYCLADLNADGVDELLIGAPYEEGAAIDLWAIFTCEDGHVVPLFACWNRERYWPCEDGIVGNYYSGVSETRGYYYYAFDGATISEVESLAWEIDGEGENYTYTYTVDGVVVASGTEDIDDCPEFSQLLEDVSQRYPELDETNLEWVAFGVGSVLDSSDASGS